MWTSLMLACAVVGQGLDVEYPIVKTTEGGVAYEIKIDDAPATRRGGVRFITLSVPEGDDGDAVMSFRIDSPTGPTPDKLVISTDRDMMAFTGKPIIVGDDYYMVLLKLTRKQLTSIAIAKRVEFNLGDVEFSLLYRQIIAVMNLDRKARGDD